MAARINSVIRGHLWKHQAIVYTTIASTTRQRPTRVHYSDKSARVKHCVHKAVFASQSISMYDRRNMDKRDEEILELKQKLIELMKENNEMKELILFLDDERNYARQFMRDFNSKQQLNWNSLKQKLASLEQKQFELIKENYSLKQLCVLLDENTNSSGVFSNKLPDTTSVQCNAKTMASVCQYILHLENELRHQGTTLERPKSVTEVLKLNSIRDGMSGSLEEKCIMDSLSETVIKSVLNR